MENTIDQTLFNEKSLYLLNIRELRVLGRKYGVPSPTTKSKKELVDYILNIVYGKIEVPVRNLYGRRPNSNSFNMEIFLDKVKTNSDLVDNYEYIPSEEILNLKVASPSSNYNLDEYVSETKVYCFENEKHFLKTMAFVKSDRDIEVTSEFAKKYKLENLDIIELVLVDGLIRVLSINGIKCVDNFENLEVSGTAIHQEMEKEFFFDDEDSMIDEIENLLQKSENNNVKTLIFSKNIYKNKNLQSINYLEDEDKTQIYKKFMNFSNICENYIKNGENILVIVENFEWIKTLFSTFDYDVSQKIEKYIDETFSKISKLGNVILQFSVESDMTY